MKHTRYFYVNLSTVTGSNSDGVTEIYNKLDLENLASLYTSAAMINNSVSDDDETIGTSYIVSRGKEALVVHDGIEISHKDHCKAIKLIGNA